MNRGELDYYDLALSLAIQEREAILSQPRPLDTIACSQCNRQAGLIDHDVLDRSQTFMCVEGHVTVENV